MFIFLAAPEFGFLTRDKETIQHLTMVQRSGVPENFINDWMRNTLSGLMRGIYELGDITREKLFNVMFCIHQNKFNEYMVDKQAFYSCIKELHNLIPLLSKDEHFIFMLPATGSDKKKFRENADFLYDMYIREEIPVNAEVMKLDYSKVLLGTNIAH